MPRLQNVYVISIHRSAICKSNKGKFSRVRPDDILSELLAKSFNLSGLADILVNKNKNKNINIDDIIIGCAMPEAEQGLNVARIASLLAGFPIVFRR